jgi:hypothetical protein
MCFSPAADLSIGLAVTAIGVDTARHVAHRKEAPLAALPVVFGVHQIIEAFVWFGEDGSVSDQTGGLAAWLYLTVAFGVIPWFIPWAIRQIEPDSARRQLMSALMVIGALVSIALMVAVVRGPIEVTDGGHYLAYGVPLSLGGFIVVVYIAATCGSFLLSSDRRAVQFGAVNLLAVMALAILLSNGLISLWCVWAAVTSVAIALHLRRTDDYKHYHRVAPASQ